MKKKLIRLEDNVLEIIQEIMQENKLTSETQTINFIISDYSKKKNDNVIMKANYDKAMYPLIISQRKLEKDMYLMKGMLNSLLYEFVNAVDLFPADEYEGSEKHTILKYAEERYSQILSSKQRSR